MADRSTRRIGGFRCESAATNLPGSAQRRGLAKSVWQAVYVLANREQNLEGGEGMLMQHVPNIVGIEALAAKRSGEGREPSGQGRAENQVLGFVLKPENVFISLAFAQSPKLARLCACTTPTDPAAPLSVRAHVPPKQLHTARCLRALPRHSLRKKR